MTLLLWLTTACTAGLEYSSDDEGQSSGTEIPVSISPKLSVGQDETLSKLRVIIFSTRNSNPYASKVLISNEVVAVDQDYKFGCFGICVLQRVAWRERKKQE